MTTATYDVLCIGNAIVDILAHVDDAFLARHDRIKSAMNLVDAATSARIYDDLPPATEISGGSAGNTAVGIAAFGGRVSYIGKVRDDQLGGIFTHDIRAAGVQFTSQPATEGEATATSIILVTPDANRTMNTYLGACGALTVADIDEATVSAAAITYVEGYLWDRPSAKDAVGKAMDIAHAHGRRVAFTLSDSFCVDRFRDEFKQLIKDRIDILFANEAEILSLYETDDLETALAAASAEVEVLAVTRGADGSVLMQGDARVAVAAQPADVTDTTGAGDLYASGVLFGLTHDLPLEVTGQLGNLAAAEIISHIGARPAADLAATARDKGLI